MCNLFFWPWPWPRRAERRANVARAREQADESREKAKQAGRISRDLHRLIEENHFAEMIQTAILGEARDKKGPGDA